MVPWITGWALDRDRALAATCPGLPAAYRLCIPATTIVR